MIMKCSSMEINELYDKEIFVTILNANSLNTKWGIFME